MVDEEIYLDKLCDEIHIIFKNGKTKTMNNLINICKEKNIMVDDYLWWQGYFNFDEYMEDIER